MRRLHVVRSLCALAFLCAPLWAQYTISTIVGTGPADGTPALTAILNAPARIAKDGAGNLYISSFYGNRVFKVDTNGALTTVAGNGGIGSSGDGGAATSALLAGPSGLAVDASGNLYIADQGNNRVRKVSNGIITTVAGTGSAGFSGDNGPATSATLSSPSSVAVDTSGNLYIGDEGNVRIRKVSGGVITTIAGNGSTGFSGDNGPAIDAAFNVPHTVAVDSSGNVYIADRLNSRVRKVSGGIITTVAGNGSTGNTGDNGSATAAQIGRPWAVTVDTAGNFYFSDTLHNVVRKVTNASGTGIITTVAGNGTLGFSGDGGPATSAMIAFPTSLAVDSAGNLFIADQTNNRVRQVSSGTITTVAGGGSAGLGGPATSAPLGQPSGVHLDSSGNLYIADLFAHRVWQVVGGVFNVVAGIGVEGFAGDSGPATSARLYYPIDAVADAGGNVYIADTSNSRVRKVASGTITTAAGTGAFAFSGDNGPATSAALNSPNAVAVDTSGNFYIADSGNNRIRKVSGGTITTVAGNGTAGFSGDNGLAINAQLSNPQFVTVDGSGAIYIADTGNSRVRKVSGGTITTVAGNGTSGFSGDGGPATSASLRTPQEVAVDAAGNLFIADGGNNRIRLVAGGVISTIAGNGTLGFSGDGGLANAASLSLPSGVAVDSAGKVYIGDSSNNRIRLLTPLPATLLSLSPRIAPAGSPDLMLTVNGTGLSSGSIVMWNGGALPTVSAKPPQITVTVSSALLASAGTASVQVGSSNILTFNIQSPAVNSLVPNSTTAGSAGFTLTVNGSNFLNTSVVQWTNGQTTTPLATTFVNSSQLTATVPASLVSATGSVTVKVVNGSAVSNSATFIIGPPPITCSASTSPPTVRFEGIAELLSDLQYACTGGSVGQTASATVTVFVNTNVTSRILSGGSEILLLIDDPPAAQQTLNTNVFQGTISGNSVTFNNVPIPGGNHTLRIVNLRANASGLGQPASNTTPVPILETTTMSVASGVIIVNNPTLTAGVLSVATAFGLGVNVSSSGDQRSLEVSFREGFANDFKTRVATGGQQSTPGQIYNTESGFVNTALLAAAGLADSATRLLLQFTNVPAGASIFVPVFPDNNSNAQLVTTDSSGAGATSFISGSSMFGGQYSQVAITNGSGVAVWEITAANPAAIETLKFNVVLTGMTQAGLGGILIVGSPGPLSIVATGSSTAPLPRFAPNTITAFVNLTLTSNSIASGSSGTQALPGWRPSELLRPLRPLSAPNVQVGSNLSFVYNLTNNGPGSAPGVAVASNLPPTLSYVSCAATGGTCAATTNADGSTTVSGSYSGSLAAGQSPSFTVQAKALASGAGTTVSVPTVVTSTTQDSFPDDNTVITTLALTSAPPPPVTVQFSTSPPGLQVKVGNNAPQASPMVTVDQAANLSFSAPTPQAGATGVQYVFNSWSDGVQQAAHPSITPPIGGGSFTAGFDTQYQVNVTASTGGTVTMSPSATNNFYTNLAPIQLTAQPTSGNAFAGSSGDVASNSNPLNLVVSGKPLNIRANFIPATLTLSPTAVIIGATAGGALMTSPQTIRVNVPLGSTWTVSANQPFISVSQPSGMGSGTFTISVVPSKLPASGSVSGMVTVSATGTTNSPQTVNVTANVVSSTAPFGSFDTPIDGTNNVVGAIAVTGWVLDNIEAAKVSLYREPVSGEGSSLIYIGDAIFVAGARPDVASGYPSYPLNNRAGWGYQLLTNFLPNKGNGTFKLHAVAVNKANTTIELGVRTIVCTNTSAAKPFGTLDTPTQGGDASGTAFANFGWVLTPLPQTIPKDGSTITAYIDGAPVGMPGYNYFRSDIATLFPGFNNSGGAVGALVLDTTKYTNGVHTIFWIAYDDASRGEGLGSRFFNIANTGASATSPARAARLVTRAPRDNTIRYRTGVSRNEALKPLKPGDPIHIGEMDRLELHLPEGSSIRDLPPGSSFDAGSGIFYWGTAPGLLGRYELVFDAAGGETWTVSVIVGRVPEIRR